MHKWNEDWISRYSNSYFKDKKIKMELKSEKKTESWNDKLKKQDDIWKYGRNKRINDLFEEELEKENPTLPRKFQIKQRETEKQVKNTKFEISKWLLFIQTSDLWIFVTQVFILSVNKNLSFVIKALIINAWSGFEFESAL